MITLEIGDHTIPDNIYNASTGSLYKDLAYGCNSTDDALTVRELEHSKVNREDKT